MFEIDNSRKHYNPFFYLQGFSREDKPSQIYLFDKKAPEKGVLSRSIKRVEVSRDAYSIRFDQHLKEKESIWGSIFSRLRHSETTDLNRLIANRSDSAPLRMWIAHFVIDTLLRSRGYRERQRESLWEGWRSLGAEIDKIFEPLDEDQLTQETGATKEKIKEILRHAAHVDDYNKWVATIIYPALTEKSKELYDCISEGSWRFFSPPESRRFITSDVPPTILRLGPEYPNWIWFQVPLTRTLLLAGYCGDAALESGTWPRDEELGDEEVDRVNKMIFRESVQFVYSSSKEELKRAIESP